MQDQEKGKTLWEMFTERLRGGGNGAGIAFANPLGLLVGSAATVPYSNGAEFADYDFSVQEIREYTRRIGGQDFQFTDYVLRGVNKKTFASTDTLPCRLRSIPKQAGGHDSLLLRLEDEFAFAEDFLGVVRDSSGTFEVKDDESGDTATFSRINELREAYEAAVLVISETTPDGKAARGKTSAVKLEYWDYWRDLDVAAGRKEFLFVEMNCDTGWFQIWRGREFYG